MSIFITKKSADYELIDSGDGEKLERFGNVVLSRPDPQALWRPKLDSSEWKKADARFSREGKEGAWVYSGAAAENSNEKTKTRWPISFSGLKFFIKPTAFKHTGLFPEQSPNWDWMREVISKAVEKNKVAPAAPEVLNLFGYTGGASLACAQAGAKVVHVDGSKAAITWAKENAELSGLADKPIRWILEDARLFAEREVKRGRFYQGIVMDPPSFGHGPDNELWKIEEHLVALVDTCFKLFSSDAFAAPAPLFFIINGYSAGYSAIAYQNILQPLVERFGGTIEIGELAIEESGVAANGQSSSGARLLPAGIVARWKA